MMDAAEGANATGATGATEPAAASSNSTPPEKKLRPATPTVTAVLRKRLVEGNLVDGISPGQTKRALQAVLEESADAALHTRTRVAQAAERVRGHPELARPHDARHQSSLVRMLSHRCAAVTPLRTGSV